MRKNNNKGNNKYSNKAINTIHQIYLNNFGFYKTKIPPQSIPKHTHNHFQHQLSTQKNITIILSYPQQELFIYILQMKLLFILSSLILASSLPTQAPIIGIYTQDSSTFQGKTFIRSGGVKYLQTAGAQVVPIFYKSSQEELVDILSQLNGVLFPGGNITIDVDKNLWSRNADFIFKYAIQQNDKGNVYPLYGICQGHQLLSYLTSGYDVNMLQLVDGQTPSIDTVQFITRNSYLLKNWTDSDFKAVTTEPGVLLYDHYWAIYLSYFNQSEKLSSFWNLIGTSTTRFNQTFTTLMEAKKYPFYTTQFHAQDNLYNIRVDEQRGNFEAVQVSQRLVQAFVQKARLSPNRFRSDEQLYKALIYNYDLTEFDQNKQGKQVYLFDK